MSEEQARTRTEDDATEPATPEDAGLRRVGPTGALVVGQPPVPVVHVLRAAARAGSPQAAEAAARGVCPGLDDGQLRTALAQEVDEVAPPPSRADALALAVTLGLGAQLASTGVGIGVTFALGAIMGPRLSQRVGLSLPVVWDPGPIRLAVVLLAGLGLVSLGRSLARQRPVARGVTAALLGLLSLALVSAAAKAPTALLFVPTCLGLGVALFAQRVLRWASPEGRLALSALPTRGYVVAVASLHVLATVLLLLVPAFVGLCAVVPLPLRPSAQLVAWLSAGCARMAWLWWPLSLLLPVPLLRVPARREQPAFLAAVLFGVFAVGSTVGALLQTFLDLP